MGKYFIDIVQVINLMFNTEQNDNISNHALGKGVPGGSKHFFSLLFWINERANDNASAVCLEG